MSAVRILLLGHKPPLPPRDGGSLAQWQMALGLAEAGHEVQVLALATPRHPDPAPGPREVAGVRLESARVETRLGPRTLARALAGTPLQLARFVDPAFGRRLTELLCGPPFDVVQVEGLPPAPWLPLVRARHRGPVVLRAHNLEQALLRDRAAACRGTWRRLGLRLAAAQLARFERRAFRDCDGVLAISAAVAEAARAAGARRVAEVGVGADVPEACPPLPRPLTAFHLGALDWEPNRAGLRELVGQVWPRVRAALPSARLHLAGSSPPAGLAAELAGPGVVFDGPVAEAGAFVRAHGVLAVPVRVSSGLRVKIVEALALGRPVVSTPAGAEGLERERDVPIVAADAPAFAAALVSLLGDPGRAAQLGGAGWELARRLWSRPVLAARALAFYDALRSRS